MILNLLLAFLAAVVIIYALIVYRVYVSQSRRIYRPLRDIIDTPAAHGFAYEDIDFVSRDGVRLHGWFVPNADARYVLLFFHGNTRNISHGINSIALFHELGFSTFVFDYRGYGRSEGKPSEQGTCLDAEAAWRWLVETRGFAPERIVLHGRSLGAAIATWLAARHEPAALVIESTFTSMPEVAAELYPLLPARLLMRYRYPVRDYLKQVHCPVLVVHGREDELIPYRHGQALFEAANEPKVFMDIEGKHYDGHMASGRHYYEGLAAFYERHLKS
jgi:uncharacterized protein